MKRLIVLFIMGLSVQAAAAQGGVTARFEPDNGSPLIGEPVMLGLTVTAPTGAAITLPTFTTDWPPFTVQGVGDVRVTTDGSTTNYRQALTVIPWQTGDFETPETIVQYQLPGSTEVLSLPVQPAYFSVPSVLKADDLTLRPFKPPVLLPYIPLWVGLMVLAGGGAAAIGGYHYWRTRRRVSHSQSDEQGHFHPAARSALADLKHIGGQRLPVDALHTQVGDCLREYMYARFGISAPEMTTEELATVLQRDLPVPRQQELLRLLERIDLVKFARLRPDGHANGRLLNLAGRWVEMVEQSVERVETVE